MNINDAKNMLAGAVVTDRPSRLNPAMTEIQARDIVLRGLSPRACEEDGVTLIPLYEKRVLQVCQNRKRPATISP